MGRIISPLWPPMTGTLKAFGSLLLPKACAAKAEALSECAGRKTDTH
jgi:hypothetical protein